MRVAAGDASGEARSISGEIVLLVLSRAFAPGAPITFSAELGGEPVVLSGKTVASKRRQDGRFDVRVRMTNLRRADRERLMAALG